MATVESGSGRAGDGGLSLDQWIALNDEIAALTKAGLPLERGLARAGEDFSGRLGKTSRDLAARLEAGQSVTEALAAEGRKFPPVYGAVVEAGVRSGDLPAALEALADYARNYADLRRAIGLALLYPLIVLTMGYGLFTAFVVLLVPRLLRAFEGLGVPVSRSLRWLEGVGDGALIWGPLVPIGFIVLVEFWVRSGSAASFPGRILGGGGTPWMRDLLKATRCANFAELLGLLVTHGVPMADAVELTARAVGDRRMVKDGEALAARLRRGETTSAAIAEARSLPPLLRWLIVSGEEQGSLAPALRHAAETYRRRALNSADVIRSFLPTALTLFIGATAVAVFALLLFVPFSALLRELSIL